MASKKMLNLLFHMDFFEHKKPATKHLYLLYTLMGGICYESYVRTWFRYITNIYFTIAVFLIQACCSVTLFQYKTIDISVLLLSVTLLISSTNIFFIIFYSYYWRESIHKSFEIINKYSKSYENYDKGMVPEDENNYTITDYNKYFKYDYVFSLILSFTFSCFIKLIVVCISLEVSSNINPLYHYNYPIPFLTHINWLTYVFIYLLQTVLLIPLLLTTIIYILFNLLFSIIIRNEVILLTNEIKRESNSVTKFLENFYEQEKKILETETYFINKIRKFSNISKERELCYDGLANHIKKWIFRYQELFTAMGLLKGYFEVISSLNLLWGTIMSISFCYMSVMTPSTKSIEYLVGIMITIPFIFICCANSHLYDSMMNELEQEIYGLPWYYLPSTHRKLILNFLSIVQRPCRVKFFKVYPIALSLYPRILMKIFSYLQIIGVMETKIQR